MKRLFMFAIGILLLSGCSSTTTSDPFDSVYITNSECELGSDFNLIDTVSYNESVPLIFVSDDGGFDPNIAGTYDVTFAITDLKDRTTSKTFSYTVKDTTPPELILDKIRVSKGY